MNPSCVARRVWSTIGAMAFLAFFSRRTGCSGTKNIMMAAAFSSPVTRYSTSSTVVGASAATSGTSSSLLMASSLGHLHSSSCHLGSQRTFSRNLRNSCPDVSSGSITALRQSTASVEETETLMKKLDTTHPAFEVIEKDIVSEYGAYCTRYRHKKSGAELLSVCNDDDNKVFGITFRTPPADSTGVPHILEHSVLCGSRKYTTKDPFVQLLKGSLQTFLNAFTYPDRTCYVVASQNTKDFYNLVNVYTDSVFFPRAISDRMVHAQEGWHLELEDKNDPLIYKGVVYNEMKGVYSSPDSLLMRESQQAIFPDNTYGVDSGGNPVNIPDLSFEQFVDFHSRYYHPSNSRIYFSGDDDVYQRLELMDSYLKDFDAFPEAVKNSKIEWQPKSFKKPTRITSTYPSGADQPQTHLMTVNWLLNDSKLTPFEELTLGILDHLLMGTTSSILRKSLMESNLGDTITGGGLSDELLQATFSVGLKGVQPDQVDNVEKLILETFEKVANDGFSEEDIAASLNTIEFQMREFNTGSFPKGLSFMLGSMSSWLYDGSPTEALKFEEPLAELKAKISESGSKVFQEFVKKFLLDNTHRSTVELTPSKTMEETILDEERKRLEETKAKLSDDDLEEIILTTAALKKLQQAEDSPEDRATIPSLELADLKRENTEYPISVSHDEAGSGITVLRHELGSTAGIAYVNFAVDLSVLPLDDVPLLPLFTKLLKETGAGPYDQVALSQRIGTHTGGVGVALLTTSVYPEGVNQGEVLTGENMVTKLLFKGKATSEKTDELFSLIRIMLTEARFSDSKSKVIEILKETRSGLESKVQSAGHSVSNSRMLARYRVKGYLDEIMAGVAHLETVKELLKQAEEDWPSLLDRLERIRSVLLSEDICRSGMVVDVTGDAKVLEAVQPSLEAFLQSLPGKSEGETRKVHDPKKEIHPWVPDIKEKMASSFPIQDEGFVVPTQVSYVGKGGMIYQPGEVVPGSAEVVSRFLKIGYLWDRVRVMGGAYGGMCQFVPSAGYFSFLSYRDPNLEETLAVYDAAADALEEAATYLESNPDALATAIIGTIGDADGVLSPDQKGFKAMQEWLTNESAEYRQKMRDEILDTKPSDFSEFAKRLRKMTKPSVAVVSSKSAFEKAAKAGTNMKLNEVL